MGLFNELGRRAEEFKQSVVDGEAETVACENCESEFKAEFDHCPGCGTAAPEE